MNALFNTDIQLWDSPACRAAYPELIVLDGSVVRRSTTGHSEVVARFASTDEAKAILGSAGWIFDKNIARTV